MLCFRASREIFGSSTPALGVETASRTDADSFLNVCAKVCSRCRYKRTPAHENSNVTKSVGKPSLAATSPLTGAATFSPLERLRTRGKPPTMGVTPQTAFALGGERAPTTIGLLNPSGGRRIRSESPYALINEHWPHTAGRDDAARTSFARSWYPCIRVRSSRTASPDAAANSRLRQILTFVGQRGRSHSGCCSASS